MFDVVGIGECVVDLVGIVSVMPKENTKKDISSFKEFIGGRVINSLLTLANLGSKTSFIGTIGNDKYGQFVKQTLKKENINIDNLGEAKGETPTHFVVLAKKTQSRTIFKKRNHLPKISQLTDSFKSTIKNSKMLLIDRKCQSVGLEAVKFAKRHNVLVAFDPSDKYNDFIRRMMSLADIFIAPLGFIRHLKNKSSPEKALKEIWNKNKKVVVLTLGPDGCMATKGDSIIRKPRYNGLKVIDTNGAGDVFHGAFAYGTLKNWSIDKTCGFANKIAALKCSILGNDLSKLRLKQYV